MLSKEQAELINNKSSIIEPCVKFAGQFLVLPDIEVFFDDCPGTAHWGQAPEIFYKENLKVL